MPRYYLLFLIPLAIFLLPVLAAVIRSEFGGEDTGEKDKKSETPHVIITQRVPSAFDAFKGKDSNCKK